MKRKREKAITITITTPITTTTIMITTMTTTIILKEEEKNNLNEKRKNNFNKDTLIIDNGMLDYQYSSLWENAYNLPHEACFGEIKFTNDDESYPKINDVECLIHHESSSEQRLG
jgi:hypothetical protein